MRALLLILTFLVATTPPYGLAQYPPDDFLEEDDFSPPPPPPPPSFTGQNEDNAPPGGAPSSPSGAGGGAANPALNALKKRKSLPPLSDARPDEIVSQNYGEFVDNFDFANIEIADLVKTMSELTGKNFIIDPAVRGKITVISPSRVTVAEAYKAFLSALAINGFTVVPSGKFWKIKNSRLAQKDNIDTYAGAYAPDSDQMITRIIHLKHISASEVNKSFRGITSKDGDLQVYDPTNSLIISDYGSNIEKITSIIRELDVPGFEEQLEVMPIRYAKAKDIAATMDKIINKDKSKAGNSTFSTGIPRYTRTSGSSSQSQAFSMVIPDDRTNAIIVVGNRAGIEKIRQLVKKLDRAVKADEAGGVYVYYVKHGDAEKIAQTLSGLAQGSKSSASTPAKGQAPVPTVDPIFGGDVKVNASKDTNSLVITASKQDYYVILNLLRKIDIARDQVYVEALILEMSAGNGLVWNPSYYKFVGDENKKVVARGGFSGGDVTQLLNPTSDRGAIIGWGDGDSLTLTTGAGEVTVKSMLAFLNVVKSTASVNVLSTPQILATDNEEASIEVGDKIPTSTQTTNTSAGSQTGVTFEDAKISLKITPHISRTDGSIRMSVEQLVSQLSTKQVQAKNLADSASIISKRTIKTNIVVRDGDTAVLGGLMTETEREEVTKVPLLGDIPILGWLFKSRVATKEKANLLVFITPKVIRTGLDRVELLDSKLNERVDFIRRNMGGRDPFGQKIEPLHQKAEAQIIKSEEGNAGTPAEAPKKR